MTDVVRVAVIGAGVMGANHARIARQLVGVELVAVVDADPARAAAAAGEAAALTTIDGLPEADLAVVAVPTDQHLEVAATLAGRGMHLLVEKPLAATQAAAQQIIDAAADAGVLLAVGHVERFNAAVIELSRHLDQPRHVRATRISPFSPRITDGVIHDLMIHDLDIVTALAGPGAEVDAVSGIARRDRSPSDDLAFVSMAFSTGLTASFETSRLAQRKVRTIEVTQDDSVVLADLVRQDITIHRMSHHEYLSGEGTRYRQSSVIELPFLEVRGEPLALELAHVAECVRSGTAPRVSGADGLRAIELADRVAAAVHRPSAR
ncbi:MAG: Gfo/Idh/MocA family oxidoreductase [Ilumatobacteraceae bacterium]